MRARALIVASLLGLGLAGACGGGAGPSFDAFRQARTLTASMEELEDRAEELTRGLTAALTDAAHTPTEAIESLRAYVVANVDEMNEVAAGIAAKFAALPEAEARAYHEVMAERFAEPTFEWRDAWFEFLDEHPDLADELREAAAPLGPQIEPVDRPI